MGVALAHMVTVLFIVPPLLWFVLRTEPKLVRRPRLMAGVIALALLPLLSYIYVYVRGAQHPEWRGAGQWASTGQWFLSFRLHAAGPRRADLVAESRSSRRNSPR